ncbi:MAG: hypothetical protein ATN35_06785 [Epulopiscium sp. Nele67-Bin004]|nr:MAG: hypothetical protein ATN35_06785 [Epulopiscium sp. Nele67-Bin004]
MLKKDCKQKHFNPKKIQVLKIKLFFLLFVFLAQQNDPVTHLRSKSSGWKRNTFMFTAQRVDFVTAS